jgi:hypothetical protein
MLLATCVFLWAISLLGIFVFGFLFGRCARKLPILDEALPWTLHWGQTAPACERNMAVQGRAATERPWPENPHQDDAATKRHSATTLACGREDCPITHRPD